MPLARLTLLLVALALGHAAAVADTLRLAPDTYNGVEVTAPSADRAATLFARAKAAAEQGDASRAIRLATETLAADPNHAAARRVLGYQRLDAEGPDRGAASRWVTPYEARQANKGLSWNSRYGWVRADDLPRLEAGERPRGRGWVSAEEDRRRHTTIDDGWLTRTDHFVVVTDHAPESAVRLAADLETQLQVWRQLFAGCERSAGELRDLFAGRRASPAAAGRLMRVFYHASKQRYADRLRRRQPVIDQTLGVYFDDLREAHFFHDDDPQAADLLRATLHHEATHQLFYEWLRARGQVGAADNFWAVEGIASYFETLVVRPGDGVATLGGRAGRTVSAARNLASGPAPMPAAELFALGRRDFQRLPELKAAYAQSAALLTMLLEGSEREHEATVAFLAALYTGRPGPDDLPRRLGVSTGELDQRYRRFLAPGGELAPAGGGQ